MQLTPIQVECYAGTKADESPRRFSWQGGRIEVDEILDRWRQVEDRPGRPRAECFRVRGTDRREYTLRHDLESDEWFVEQAAG